MQTRSPSRSSRSEAQFGIASLLGFVTVCAVLSALSAVAGLAASVLLMLMAGALWARQGGLAVAMFVAASLAADWQPQAPANASSELRQVMVLLLGGLLAAFYCLRRRT